MIPLHIWQPQYVPPWIKVPFLSTPKLSSQTIPLLSALVLGVEQMLNCLSIPGLRVNLKTATLRHRLCFYNLNFHTEWRKTVLSCTCLSPSLFTCAIQKTLPVYWRTSWWVKKWLGQKVNFTYHTALHHLWAWWITGKVKQVCREMKWKKIVLLWDTQEGCLLFPGPESLILLFLLVRKSGIPDSEPFNLFITSDRTSLTLQGLPCTLRFSQCFWPNLYWTSEALWTVSFNFMG